MVVWPPLRLFYRPDYVWTLRTQDLFPRAQWLVVTPRLLLSLSPHTVPSLVILPAAMFVVTHLV